jgi:hypothetical protein
LNWPERTTTGFAYERAASTAPREPEREKTPPLARTEWAPMMSLVQRGKRAWTDESGMRMVGIPAELREAASEWPRNLLFS